jgi:hypothetical protein
MKKFLTFTWLMFSHFAMAGSITWSLPQAISNSDEVIKSGSLVLAKQCHSNSQTMDGTLFSGGSSTQSTQNGVTFSLTGLQSFENSEFLGSKILVGSQASAYGTMLSGAWYNDAGNISVSLSGLAVGRNYLVQFWISDFRQYPNDRKNSILDSAALAFLKGNGSDTASGSGSRVSGRFTADSTTQVFPFSALSGTTTQLNAFQLRDVSPVEPPRISNFVRDPNTGQTSITWFSRENDFYNIESSETLLDWRKSAEAFPSQGLETTWQDLTASVVPKRFYRLAAATDFPVRQGLTAIDSNGQLNFDRSKWLARNNLVYQSPPTLDSESIPLGSGRVGAALWVDPVNGLTAHLNRPEGVPAMGGLGTVRIRNLSSLATLGSYRGTLALHDGIFNQQAGNLKVTSFFRWSGEELVIDVQGAPPTEMVTVELSTYKNTFNTIASNVPGAEVSGENCIAVCGADGSLPNSYPGFRATQFLAAQAAGTNVVAASNASGATLTFKPNSNGTYRVVVPVKIWTGNPVNLASLKSEALAATAAPLATDSFASIIATQKTAFQAMWQNCSMIRLASKDGQTRYIEQMISLDTYIRLSAALTPIPAAGGGDTRMFGWKPTGIWALLHYYQNLRPLNYANLASGLPQANFATWNTLSNWLPALRQHVTTTFPTYEGTGFPEFTDGQPGTAGSLLTSQFYDNNKNLTPPGVRWFHSRMFSTTLETVALAIAEYRYRQDETFLTNQWPIIREGMLFHRSLLMSTGLAADGKYHYLGVNSRENNWDDDDDMPDVANIRALLPVVMELAQVRGDTTLVSKLNDLVGKLPELPTTTRDGVPTFAWSAISRDTGHNEENPDLDAIWPANAIGDASEPALVQLAQNTLNKRIFKETYDWHPTTIQAARMGRADIYQSALLSGIEKFLVYSQGFSSWSGTSGNQDINTEFIAVQSYAAHEALVQNYDGLLRFANAWPSNWEAIAWLPTEGGHRIGLEVAAGTLQVATVDLGSSSLAMRIRNPWPGQAFSIRDLTAATQLHSGSQAVGSVAAIKGHRLLIEKISKPLNSFSYQSIVDYPNNGPTSLGSRSFGKAATR